jgi:hypothetical protein
MLTEPAATPETTPEVLTVARVVSLLLHVPPDVASVKETLELTQIGVTPEMLDGVAGAVLTVIAKRAVSDPQELVTI